MQKMTTYVVYTIDICRGPTEASCKLVELMHAQEMLLQVFKGRFLCPISKALA